MMNNGHDSPTGETPPCPDNIQGTFYSVFAPGEARPQGFEVCNYIFGNKVDALKFVKKTKKARFRHFNCYDEALAFATQGQVDVKDDGNEKHASRMPSVSSQMVGEKVSLFKGPKPQDLVKLRKAIETNDYDYVRRFVWENPRYLVSSGDTPSILQEGFRYNALHVAAKARHQSMAELVLSTISNPNFIRLLYGDDSNENVENRIQVLIDLYLNTPDKGLNETPLHFAVKFGAAEVVEVLVSFSQCDKSLKNKFGQTPDMIICDRCDKERDDIAEAKRKIAMLLENNYYVPVLRAEDNSIMPVIGQPFVAGNPLDINSDPLSPRLEIHAYAGPMNRQGAEQFRKVWKTPPRTSTPVRGRAEASIDSIMSLKYTDPSKGLERIGQKLASKFDVNWKEYWPFLDSFVDIASKEGLILLENHLASRATIVDRSWVQELTPSASFAKKSVNNNSTMSELCSAMQACNLHDSYTPNHFDGSIYKDFTPYSYVDKNCDLLSIRIACDMSKSVLAHFNTAVQVLDGHIRQIEQLVISYMEDVRFHKVNFQHVHDRLAQMISRKIARNSTRTSRKEHARLLAKFAKEGARLFDCFSSDEDSKCANKHKTTSYKKQMMCLVRHVTTHFGGGGDDDDSDWVAPVGEQDCRDAWNKAKECTCTFKITKKIRKSLRLSKNSRLKTGSWSDSCIARNIFSVDSAEESPNVSQEIPEEDSDDYFTPPTTPRRLTISEDEDDFGDAQLLVELFIEDDNPTKTDCAVFNALRCADCHLSCDTYPNIYRWYHSVNLYSDEDRSRWLPFKESNGLQETTLPSVPVASPVHKPSMSKSWLRITGCNSPKAATMKNK